MSVIKVIRVVRVQALLLVLIFTLSVLSEAGMLPQADEIRGIIFEALQTYGLPLVAVLSFFENIPVFNAYLPGSIVILSAMAMTNGNPSLAVLTFSFIIVPSLLAQIFNYFLGFRLANNDSQGRHPSYAYRTWALFFGTFWHPHFASMTCLVVGKEKMPFFDFVKYLIPSSLFWNCFWALAMYNLGNFIKSGPILIFVMIAYIVLWALWDIRKCYRKANSR